MSDSARLDYSYQEVKEIVRQVNLSCKEGEEIRIANLVTKVQNPYSKEDREGLERLAAERIRGLILSAIKGEHIISKECWCKPQVINVKGAKNEMPEL